MVFQDPFASLNPVHRVRYDLVRPLKIHDLAGEDIDAAIADLLRRVALEPPAQFANKFPHELSGGQRQRVAIARALSVRPRVLLADEPVSMLDVSIRLGILNLLADLRDREHLAILYVTHDIASARYLADTIVVMYAGQVVEAAPERAAHRQPGPPLHPAAALRGPRPGPGRAPEPGRPRRTAQPDRSAERLPVPPPLPARHGDLQCQGTPERHGRGGPQPPTAGSTSTRRSAGSTTRPEPAPAPTDGMFQRPAAASL